MSKLSPDTIEKLEWLKGRLRKYPHRYNQEEWCGKQACLAGYIFPKLLGKRCVTLPANSHGWSGLNWSGWLGISDSGADLLDMAEWIGKAAKFNRLETDTDERAVEKACQRIDLFIRSGGTQ